MFCRLVCYFSMGYFDQVSLEKSAEASQELDRQRDVYRDFARAGSTLFFLVEAMQVCQESDVFSSFFHGTATNIEDVSSRSKM